MTGERTSPTLTALLAALSGCVADSGDETVSLTPVENWTTEVEFEFGDVFQGDALFAGIADVDVSPDGSRVYVVDYRASEGDDLDARRNPGPPVWAGGRGAG